MENTKNFFENWAETQQKMLETWTEKTQEFQKNVFGSQPIAKGTEIYQDWLKKQQENLKTFTKGAEKTADNVASEANNVFDNFFDQWKNVQEKTIEMWSGASNKMNEFVTAFTMGQQTGAVAGTIMEQTKKYQEAWQNGLKTMTDAINMPMGGKIEEFASKTIHETMGAMQKGADNFKKLYELWSPVFKAAQSNVFSTEEYKKLMNPVMYKELMDKMFGFDALNPLKQGYDQYMKTASTWYENMGGKAKESYDSWKASMEEFANKLPQNQEMMSEMFKNFSTQLKSSVSPFFKLMPDSREKAQMMLMNELGDLYIASANKLANLQHIVYKQGAKVNEKILEAIAAKVKDGKPETDFTEFYNNWISENGKAFEDLFHTDEFSKLQGELVTLDAQIRSTSDKLMEHALAPYPVVLKSQLDELYKTNYELKKQVYEMSKQVASMVNGKATATTATETHAAEAPKAAKTATATAAKKK
jgi:hypothetical protein